ncbi:MAG: YbfB/YjiJ family MFS transporter, partial [Chlamydiia bacterium]|nr:YbfB/YjiJ family MFS transporter [Chlamydiia bacterium]
MSSLLRLLIAPFISLACLMLGNGFFVTFTSMRLKLDGASPEMLGLVNAAYYAGFLLGAARIEGLISRVRHIRAFAAFAGILSVATMLQGLIDSPIAWIFIRFVAGLSIAALYIVIESWFLVISPDH